MAVATAYYVDPSIAGDSGAGTIGDPYGDIQHALDTITRDSSNGDILHIKAGTDEILAASLDLTTYGTPVLAARLLFRGYTTAANDGGIGGISGGGNYSIFSSVAYNYITFMDMHLHNSGSVDVIILRDSIRFLNCEIDNSTSGGIDIDNFGFIHNCYIHNVSGLGIDMLHYGFVSHCALENGTNTFSTALSIGINAYVTNNIVSVTGATNGINSSSWPTMMRQNTIYSVSGTGNGLNIANGNSDFAYFENNYIEGFSGTGGIGIYVISGADSNFIRNNRFYNNTANVTVSGSAIENTNNTSVGSSALTDPGSGDFSVGTDLKAVAIPTTFKGISTDQFMDIGAAQREEPAGGGGTTGKQGLHAIEAGAV